MSEIIIVSMLLVLIVLAVRTLMEDLNYKK